MANPNGSFFIHSAASQKDLVVMAWSHFPPAGRTKANIIALLHAFFQGAYILCINEEQTEIWFERTDVELPIRVPPVRLTRAIEHIINTFNLKVKE